MKTIKYTVDRGFRRAGEVRAEEDAIAENLILRGFAEETDEEPDEKTGEAQAVDQYDPQGSEPDDLTHGGAGSLPAELNAPGVVGSNAPSGSQSAGRGRGGKAASETVPPTATETASAGEVTQAGSADSENASEGHEASDGAETQTGAEGTEDENH